MRENPKQLALELGVHPSLAAYLEGDVQGIAAEGFSGKGDAVLVGSSRRVVIVTTVYNRKTITLQALRSLSRIDRNDLDIHIVVVDDGSTDGTGEAIRRHFPEVEVITGDGNLWDTRGSNIGFRAALKRKPDYILWINDDSIFHEQFLVRMVYCAETYPKSVVGALLLRWDSPRQVYQCSPRWSTWYGGLWWPRYQTVDSIPQEPWEVYFIAGNCVLFPRQVLEQVGVMNERAFPYHNGDAEYLPRIRKAGWRLLIEPKAWVWIQPNEIAPSKTCPPRWREVPKTRLLYELFWDRRSARNLLHCFYMRWYSAPYPWLGLIAFCVSTIRRGLRVLGLGGSWPDWPDPPFRLQ